MKAHLPVVAIVAAAVLCAGVATWLLWKPRQGGSPASRPSQAAAVERRSKDGPNLSLGETGDSYDPVPEVRTPVASDGISGRVVDHDHLPVAGARVTATPVEPGGPLWSTSMGAEVPALVQCTTAQDGSFALAVEPGVTHDVRARASGFGEVVERSLLGGDAVTLVLEEECRLRGRVLEKATGEGVPGARLELHHLDRDFQLNRAFQRIVTADEKGRFAMSELPPGVAFVDAIDVHSGRSAQLEVKLEEGSEVLLEFELEASGSVEGEVRDAFTQEPVSGAQIMDFRGWNLATTGDRGTFSLSVHGHLIAAITANGYGRERVELLVPGGMKRLAEPLLLFPARSVHGRVLYPDGTPAAGAQVGCLNAQNEDEFHRTLTDERGEYRFDQLHHRGRHAISVRAQGFASVNYHLPLQELSEPRMGLPDVVLRPGVVLVGQVVDESDNPWPGARVRLDGENADCVSWSEGHGLFWNRSTLRRREIQCDAAGAFRFPDLSAGFFRLSVQVESALPPEAIRIEIAPDQEQLEVSVELYRGSGLRGRVVVPSGRGVPGVMVIVTSFQSGDPSSCRVNTQEDGSFVVFGLTGERCDLMLMKSFVDSPDLRFPVIRPEFEVSNQALLEVPEPVVVRGQVQLPIPPDGFLGVVRSSQPVDEATWLEPAEDGRFELIAAQGDALDFYYLNQRILENVRPGEAPIQLAWPGSGED